VHPQWVRRGIAGRLLGACEEAAREQGFERIEMGATLSGVPFYARMGYSERGQEEVAVGEVGEGEEVKERVTITVVRMEKTLD